MTETSTTHQRGKRRAAISTLAALALIASTVPLSTTAQGADGTGTYAGWTTPTGTPPSTTGSFTSTPFPNVTAAAQLGNGTTSRDATISVASSATLSSNTPFGARFGSSLRKQYLNIGGPNSSTITAQVVLTFASPAPAGRWGFALGDVDAEEVTISATGPGGTLTEAQLNWRGAFNYANKAVLPTWNPSTATLTGSGNNTDGESGWFAPLVDVTSVTLTQRSLTGFPSYQLWIATDDTPATPICEDGPQPDGSEVVCFLSVTNTPWRVPSRVTNIDYLVVGGGGGGGADNGGGGGGGGMLTGSASVTPGTALSITVGAGGAAGTGVHPNSTAGGDGGDSSLNLGSQTVLAKGGGGGGAGQVTSGGIDLNPGRPGGSGGGGAGERAAVTPGGSGISGQGTTGGAGASTGGGGGGGGGGAGVVGASGSGKAGGNGGAGRSSSITGRDTIFAGGGGGAGDVYTDPQGTGGTGGGGAAGNPAGAGAVNTGGGGGGGSYNSTLGTASGAAGGSGIVVIRYLITPYTVAYNANGGTGSPSSTSAYAGDAFTVSLTQPTRTGYTFTGWNTLANGAGTPYAAGTTFTMPGSNLTLYAQWTAITYTLTYNANSGIGAPGSAIFAYGSTATVSLTVPTRDGFWFNGWNSAANGTGDAYAANSTFTMLGNLTLYAQWVGDEFDLAYNANGGTGAPIAETRTVNTTAPLSATVPTRTGYTFKEWYSNLAGTGGTGYAPGQNFTMPAGDTIIYAQWTPVQYTVSYDANGGTGAPGPQSTTYLGTSTVGVAPTRAGFLFTGWNTAANGSGTMYAPGGSLLLTTAANLTLYAQWAPETFELDYDANGGTGGPFGTISPAGFPVTVSSVTPSQSGFTFGGWNTAADGSGTTYSAGSTLTMPGSNLTLYARWIGPPGPGPSPTPTPEPTPTAEPSPEPVVDKPFVNDTIKDLPAGQAVAYEGSQQVPINVVSNSTQGTQTIQGSTWSLDLVALQPDGKPAPLTSSGAVDATAGGTVAVSGSGFAPGTVVNVFLIDPAQSLGSFSVAADGTFRGNVPIPAGLTPGRYVIQANGTTPNGIVRSTSVGILIGGAAVVKKMKLKTTVYFDARSAVLDKKAKRKIARLAAKVPEGAVIVRIRSVGFVQRESFIANDQRLSTKRARNVARQLRKEGVRGPTVIRGNGRAKESGAKARRATATVTYQIYR